MSISKVFIKTSHAHLIAIIFWLLLHYKGRVEHMGQRLYDLQSLGYLLPVPLQKTFSGPRFRVQNLITMCEDWRDTNLSVLITDCLGHSLTWSPCIYNVFLSPYLTHNAWSPHRTISFKQWLLNFCLLASPRVSSRTSNCPLDVSIWVVLKLIVYKMELATLLWELILCYHSLVW